MLASLIPFVLSIVLWTNFQSDAIGYQFEEKYTWYAAIGSSLHLGVDGLSLTMVLLTTLPDAARSAGLLQHHATASKPT